MENQAKWVPEMSRLAKLTLAFSLFVSAVIVIAWLVLVGTYDFYVKAQTFVALLLQLTLTIYLVWKEKTHKFRFLIIGAILFVLNLILWSFAMDAVGYPSVL